jgi:hypothetical protein
MSVRPRYRSCVPGARRLALAALAGAALFIVSPARADEPWRASEAERRERLLKMDAAEKERLERQTERFESLAPAEKEKLRDVHEELSAATDGEQLFAVLQRYCEWLKTLNAADRSELLSLPAESRVARIRELMKDQEEKRLRQLANLSYEDTRAVLDWLDKMVEPHESQLAALLSRESREFVQRFDDPRVRRKMTVWSLFREGKRDELRETIQPSPEDLALLLNQLSQQKKDEFNKIGDLQTQQDTVRGWIFWSVFRPSYRPVSDKELHKFFTGLPTEKQAELERLPREEMHHELRKLYYASRFRGPEWGSPGDGGAPGRPPFPRSFNRDDGGGGRYERRPEEKQQFAKPPGS